MPDNATIAMSMCRKAMLPERPSTLRFTYRDSKGAESTREVEPYEVKDGKLFGFCLEKLQIRQFTLESMTSISLGKEFVPRNGWPIKVDL